MTQEFEGKTEKEAIDKAVSKLNLAREKFDVEVLESSKGFLFKKGTVRIRVHYDTDGKKIQQDVAQPMDNASHVAQEIKAVVSGRMSANKVGDDTADDYVEIEPEVKEDLAVYLETLIDKMGFPGNVLARQKESRKVILDIKSDHSGIIIGKKGKNLDALQLLTNVYAGRKHANIRVVVDAEDYRNRREEKLVRLADRAAKQVRKTKNSKLLEPMNPFERRLIHTTLNDMNDIETKSEGDGLFKQVRVIYRGQ